MDSGTENKKNIPARKRKIGRKILIALILLCAVIFIFEITKKIDVIIIGIDNVEKYSKHADTIILASFSPFKNKVKIISIPRDTLVFNDKMQRVKINALFAYGYNKNGYKKGAELIIEKVEELLNIHIPFYFCMDYEGFIRFIDFIGGVPVNVKERMKYEDKAGHLNIDLFPGEQVLNGTKALNYVRFRSDRWADIGRIKRQQEFLCSLLQKVKTAGVYTKVPQIIKSIKEYIYTNLYPHNMLVLANSFRGVNMENITMKVLPGDSLSINGISYWQLDKAAVDKLKKDFLK